MELKHYIGAKIKEYRKDNKMTQEDLADRLNTTKQTIGRYEKGARKVNQDILFKLCDIFHVTLDDFFPTDTIDNYGQEDTLLNQITDITAQLTLSRQNNVYNYAEEQLNEQNGQIQEDNIVPIVFGRQSAAGSMIYVDDVDAEMGVLPSSIVPNGANELVQITGDSMEPIIKKGSEVYLRYQPTVEDGEIAIVRIEDEGVTCKYLFRDGKNIVLKSENSKYDDIVVDANKVSVIGKVLI